MSYFAALAGLWAVTQAHSLGTRTEWPVAQAWGHVPDSSLLCVSAQHRPPEGVTGSPAAHQISPLLWPHSSWETILFNLEQVAGGEGGSGIAKAAPEHPPGQSVPGQPWVVWCAWTAGVRLQAPACGPGVTAWQAQAVLQTLPQSQLGLGALDLFPGLCAAVLQVAA